MESKIRDQKLSLVECLQKYSRRFSFEMAAYILEYNSPTSFGKEISITNAPFRTHSINSFHLRGTEMENIFETAGVKTIYTERLSLSGLNAPLPTPYAELIFRRNQEKDTAISSFINTFNTRLLGISYQISKRRYLSLQKHFCNTNCMLTRTIAAFSGESSETMDRKMSRLSYLFWTKEKSATGLEAIIAASFGLVTKVGEFRTFWAKRQETYSLGHVILGKSAELGKKVSISSFGINIRITHHNYEKIYQLLTDKKYLADLKFLIKKYCGEFNSCILSIVPQQAPPLQIDSAILGKTSWLPGEKLDYAVVTI
jgi:predicted component of type VI protein secretion system